MLVNIVTFKQSIYKFGVSNLLQVYLIVKLVLESVHIICVEDDEPVDGTRWQRA